MEAGCFRVELNVVTTRKGNDCVVAVSGEVDIYTSPQLKAVLTGADVHGCARIVLDLDGVGFIDSSGLGVLVGALRRSREAGVDLMLVSSQASFARILRITGLDSVFILHSSVAEALGA